MLATDQRALDAAVNEAITLARSELELPSFHWFWTQKRGMCSGTCSKPKSWLRNHDWPIIRLGLPFYERMIAREGLVTAKDAVKKTILHELAHAVTLAGHERLEFQDTLDRLEQLLEEA